MMKQQRRGFSVEAAEINLVAFTCSKGIRADCKGQHA